MLTAILNFFGIEYERPIWAKQVRIWCPACEHEQTAKVMQFKNDPAPCYVHECIKCGYWIMESEWNEV